MARTELHPWQKEISQEAYLTKMKEAPFSVGYFKPTDQYYEVDFENPEYKKRKAEKEKKRKNTVKVPKDIYKARLERKYEVGVKVGKREGVKEFKEEKLPKIIASAEKRGMKMAKPKQNKLEKLKRAKEKLKLEKERIDMLEKQVKATEPAKKPTKEPKKEPENKEE